MIILPPLDTKTLPGTFNIPFTCPSRICVFAGLRSCRPENIGLLGKMFNAHRRSKAMKLNLGSKFLFAAVFAPAMLFLATGIAAAQNLSLLYNFKGQDDGGRPYGGLILDSSGNLYGTTSVGGTYNHGTVFELVNTSGAYSEKVLYSFTNLNGDGAQPQAGLLMDSSGDLYGTTFQGGSYGYGTVFELVDSSGSYTEKVLYNFAGQGDGAWPTAGLITDSSGNLYGTTTGGGVSGWGTVFELVNSAGSYSEHLLYSFKGPGDGGWPYAGVIMDSSGNLYGTTYYGGAGGLYGSGVVFELVNSSGVFSERVLYSFANSNGDGTNPAGGLVRDSLGNLYGTTYSGGGNYSGTVFELVNSSGLFSEKVLYSFGFTGYPYAGLIMDSSGNLYGTTTQGTVFELKNSSGNYSETGLVSSCLGGSYGSLIMDASGNLYGTTQGNGSVFSLTDLTGSPAPTTTTLGSSSNPANAGQGLMFTATIGPFLVTNGTVTFSAGGTTLGTSSVYCGTANWTLQDALELGIGSTTVTAQYNPVQSSLAPSSGTLNQAVTEAGVVLTNGNNTLTGNETVNGNVNATTFVGNGSGLTSVVASSLNCAFCIGNSQLGISYAGSASQGGPASNALMLGGLMPSSFQPAGSYATTGANFFTGNQSVAGDLSTTGNTATTGTTTIGPSGAPIVQHLSMTFNPSFQALGQGCASKSFTFPGVNDGDTVALGVPNERVTAADVIYTGWVSAAGTVTIRACAFSTKLKNLGSGVIRVDVWQH